MGKKSSNISRLKRGIISESSSLVARASQIMAIYIALGLLSMISSMLVSESLTGDAAQINHAGALRMQAVRVSRAHLTDDTVDKAIINQESEIFEQRLQQLFAGSITPIDQDSDIANQYHIIKRHWQALKNNQNDHQVQEFDGFVKSIDKLVTLLQHQSERKLNMLRLIQGISLFSLLLISAFVLVRLNKLVIVPLQDLVEVAKKIAKGNFDTQVHYQQENELGVLAQTINQMSSELKATYENFELRVQQKTAALTISNQSLELLYQLARQLNTEFALTPAITKQINSALGQGNIEFIKTDQKDVMHSHEYTIHVGNSSAQYGYLIWHNPPEQQEKWQHQLLQAIADLIATSIELEQTQLNESRLLIFEERAVIARELHDSLAQSLSYLKVQTGLLERKLQKQLPQEQLNETILDIKSGLANAYQQLRELLTTFRLKLDDPSLLNALKGTISEFSAKCHFDIQLAYDLPENQLSAAQEVHVLQIIREALSNVHRHAQATNAGVDISYHNSKVSVKIWDDGIGIANDFTPHGHFGLGIMEERAKSLGTLISVTNNQPSGTCIEFEFQL